MTTSKAKAAEVGGLQFPSLEGAEDVEVAKRSADTERYAASKFRRVIVTPPRSVDTLDTDERLEQFHADNLVAIRRQAEQQGLRCTGEGVFVSQKLNADGVSHDWTYDVPVQPAATEDPSDRFVEEHVVLPGEEKPEVEMARPDTSVPQPKLEQGDDSENEGQ